MRSVSKTRLVFIVGCLTAFAACSKNEDTQKGGGRTPLAQPQAADEVNLIAPMTGLDEAANPIFEPARSGKPIKRSELLDQIYETELLAFYDNLTDRDKEALPEDFETQSQARMSDLVQQVNQSKTPTQGLPSKENIDAVLESKLGKPLAYDPEAVTMFDVIHVDALGSESGSVLYSYVQLSSVTGAEYQKQNPVMILESGRYYPGRMIQQPNGRYRLVGMDLATSSHSLIDYGYGDELHQNLRVKARGLRVIDGVTFLAIHALAEAFSDEQAYEDYQSAALEKTALKYGIPYQELEEINRTKRDQPSPFDSFRRRPFAFGDSGKPIRLEKRPEGAGYANLAELPAQDSVAPNPLIPNPH